MQIIIIILYIYVDFKLITQITQLCTYTNPVRVLGREGSPIEAKPAPQSHQFIE